jgi:hypothetical protein
MRKVGYAALAYALVNLILFSSYFALEPPKVQSYSKPEFVLVTVGIVFPIVYYFVSLYVHANAELKKGIASGVVVKHGYAFAVAINLGFIFPWFVFGVGPEGRVTFITIGDIVGYVVSTILGAVLMGGLLGLFGMMLVNHLCWLRSNDSPNKAL